MRDFDQFFRERIGDLKAEGRYRVFADLERIQGRFPKALYRASPGDAPQAATGAKIAQGALEKSNVRGVVEMSRMIEITRSYTQVATLLQQQSDLSQQSVDKLADVPN